MAEIVFSYQKPRSKFGRFCKFEDHEAESLLDVFPNPALTADYIQRMPLHMEIQHVPEYSERKVGTDRKELASQGISHLEGGWPKDVDPSEPDQKARYRKKAEKEEEYIRSVRGLADRVEHYCKQNTAINIYEEYFADTTTNHATEPPSAKTLTVLRDPSTSKRTATHISWLPNDGRKLAVAYCVLQFQPPTESTSIKSYIWDLTNPNIPEMELIPPSPLCCLEYNTKDAHFLVGGCYNGLLSYWDTRKGPNPVDSSPIEKSHRDPVYDVKWLQSKTGTECMSVSTDGQVLIWDTRKMQEPTEILPLEPRSSEFVSGLLGGVSIDYDPQTSGPSKFMIGTEQGVVLSCNRKAKTPAERIAQVYGTHHGPVYAIQRNTFFPKYFLTVGDWTARIWNDDLRSYIMTTKYHSSYVTDGCWSPTRPGVFFTTKADGTLDIWDYMYKQNNAVLSVQVSDAGLHTLRVHEEGKMVAVGATDGTCTLLELSESLYVRQAAEKDVVGQMLEREREREKNLGNRAKELRKQKSAPKQTDAEKKAAASADSDAIKELTERYFDEVRKSQGTEKSPVSTEPASTAAASSSSTVPAATPAAPKKEETPAAPPAAPTPTPPAPAPAAPTPAQPAPAAPSPAPAQPAVSESPKVPAPAQPVVSPAASEPQKAPAQPVPEPQKAPTIVDKDGDGKPDASAPAPAPAAPATTTTPTVPAAASPAPADQKPATTGTAPSPAPAIVDKDGDGKPDVPPSAKQ